VPYAGDPGRYEWRHKAGIAPETRPPRVTCGGVPSSHAGHDAVPIGVVPEDPLAGEVSHQPGVPGAQGTEACAASHEGMRPAIRRHRQAPSEPTCPISMGPDASSRAPGACRSHRSVRILRMQRVPHYNVIYPAGSRAITAWRTAPHSSLRFQRSARSPRPRRRVRAGLCTIHPRQWFSGSHPSCAR